MSNRPTIERAALRSRTPIFRGDSTSFANMLARVRNDDLSRLKTLCQERHHRLQARVRQTRYEDCGIALEMIYAIGEADAFRDRFKDAFEHEFEGELKANRLNRQVFLFLYGNARKDLAGTDALALADAIRRRIAPDKIPAYIRWAGGLDKLLKAERSRRNPLDVIEISIRRTALKQLNRVTLGGSVGAVIKRSSNEHAEPRHAIVVVK